MEKLYIKIEKGLPVGHPILESNLKIIDPSFDSNNLQENYLPFEKVEFFNDAGVYETLVASYFIVDGVVKEKYSAIQMTAEEKLKKQNDAKAAWELNSFYKSWIFNEEICNFEPPVKFPSDGKKYIWNEETISWVEVK
jgi:hypothetical protein